MKQLSSVWCSRVAIAFGVHNTKHIQKHVVKVHLEMIRFCVE